jgi:flagellar basal body-associated protein FliL
MDKLKKAWENNRILFVLVCILIVCFITIIIISCSFFFSGSKSTYGDRLNNIDDHPITDEFKSSYLGNIKENKIVSDATMEVSGRIIYVTISFNTNTTLDEAKSVATKSIDKLSDNLIDYYDISFTLKCNGSDSSDGFNIMGAHNVSGNGVIWNNNTVTESES